MVVTRAAKLGNLTTLLFVGCGGGAMLAGDAGTGGGGNATLTFPQGGAGGLIVAGGASGQGGSGGTNSSGACTRITCTADFPCSASSNGNPDCVPGAPNSIRVGHDVSCAETCGTPCCSGGSCRLTTEACPADKVCVYSAPSTTRRADCVAKDQTCGGVEGTPCASTEYCEYFGTACSSSQSSCAGLTDPCKYVAAGAHGLCQKLPTAADCANFTAAVCGCDGITYKSDCARKAANTAQAHTGACP